MSELDELINKYPELEQARAETLRGAVTRASFVPIRNMPR
jgi:hypothetical protein